MKSEVNEKGKLKSSGQETSTESSKKNLKGLEPIISFVLAFLIASIVVIIFFIATKALSFTNTFHFEFWIKAIIALLLSALILRVADIVSPEKKLYSRAVPTALMTVFICLIIFHYGYMTPPSSNVDFPSFNSEKSENPKMTFSLNYLEESNLIIIPDNSNYRVFGSQGDYEMIFECGQRVRVSPSQDTHIPHMKEAKFWIKSNFVGVQKFEIYWSRR